MNRISIGSDNGLSPIRRQAIIQTNAGLLSIGRLGTNLSEILIKIPNFSFTKMHLYISFGKRWPFCPVGDAFWHYNDIIMSTMVSQITSLTIVYSTVYSGTDQRNHQRSASLAFVRGIHPQTPLTGELPAQRASNAEKCFHFMTSSWDVAAHVEFIVDITIELASDEFYICCIFGDGDFGTWALSVCHLWRWETNSLCCAIYVRGWRVGTFF